MKQVVAIIGRPNVGKSTFFNRITRSRQAIVNDLPGITRDRNYKETSWNNKEFIVVDTGGFISNDEDGFAGQIHFQVKEAINQADIVIFILDGKFGVSPYDIDIIEILREIPEKIVFYVVNKIDGMEKEVNLYDFYSLGVEPLYSLSAEHGYGINDFMDTLTRKLPEVVENDIDDEIIKIAVVGRPNAGKSSLINRILKEKRLLVSDVPGTTRDSIDTFCKIDNNPYLLIDTAGIRRKGKVSFKIEKFSIIKALKSLDRCDIALILVDSSEGVTDQDVRIAGYAHERGCGCLFLLNKWDLVEKDSKSVKRYVEQLKDDAKFLNFAPALTISALTGLRTHKIFNLVNQIYKQYETRITTGKVNQIIEKAVQRNEPSLYRGRRIKFLYSAQISTKPPTIVCFVNYPEAVHFSYKRYLMNRFREATGLDKVPIRIFFKKRTQKIKFGKTRSGREIRSKIE